MRRVICIMICVPLACVHLVHSKLAMKTWPSPVGIFHTLTSYQYSQLKQWHRNETVVAFTASAAKANAEEHLRKFDHSPCHQTSNYRLLTPTCCICTCVSIVIGAYKRLYSIPATHITMNNAYLQLMLVIYFQRWVAFTIQYRSMNPLLYTHNVSYQQMMNCCPVFGTYILFCEGYSLFY